MPYSAEGDLLSDETKQESHRAGRALGCPWPHGVKALLLF